MSSEKKATGQQARELFIERNAIQAEASGLSRIAGRLIAVMLLDGGPISFADLAERMQASRASVSTNTRLLERVGVIERVAVRGERQDFFQLQANPFAMAIQQSIQECQRFSGYVDDLLSSCELDEDAIDRLLEAQYFHRVTAQAMQEMLDKLDHEGWKAGAAPQRAGKTVPPASKTAAGAAGSRRSATPGRAPAKKQAAKGTQDKVKAGKASR